MIEKKYRIIPYGPSGWKIQYQYLDKDFNTKISGGEYAWYNLSTILATKCGAKRVIKRMLREDLKVIGRWIKEVYRKKTIEPEEYP